jgi:AAA domain
MLDRHRDACMVVIDVFAKMRGVSPPGMSAYDADYAAVGRAKRIADAYGVAVVLVHHVRKAGSEDFLEMVSGTNGLAGAADETMVLKRARGQADGALFATGRDVDEAEYALAFQPACGAAAARRTGQRPHHRRHPRRNHPAPARQPRQHAQNDCRGYRPQPCHRPADLYPHVGRCAGHLRRGRPVRAACRPRRDCHRCHWCHSTGPDLGKQC